MYLTFDKENYLNNQGEIKYVFSTEGHFYPINLAYEIRKLKTKDFNQMDQEEEEEKNYFDSKRYYHMRFNLPMKIKYFDQLFELVGVDDNLTELLVRK